MRRTAGRNIRIPSTRGNGTRRIPRWLALNDVWKLGDDQELQLSGFFRTYNLSLDSDFGLGLIRQSEFRTVAGGSAAYRRKFSKTPDAAGGGGLSSAKRRGATTWTITISTIPPIPLLRAIRQIDGNNVTIAPVSPYVAVGGRTEQVRALLPWDGGATKSASPTRT